MTSPVAFVGEAWGIEEAVRKRPFVGRSGLEFDSWLRHAGLSRGQVFITNVLCQHPPKNDLSVFINLSPTKTKPVSDAPRYGEWMENVSRLKEELAALPRLNLVVPIGRAAFYALTGNMEITKYRGSILECELAPGVVKKCIPILHPANAVRGDWDTKVFSQTDMVRIAEEMRYPERRLPQRTIEIARTMEQVERAIKRVAACPLVAFDIEAINGEVSHISLSGSSDYTVSIPFLEPWRNVWTVAEEAEIWWMLRNLLVYHPCMAKNSTYDAYFLWRKFGFVCKVIEDPEVIQALSHPGLPKNLGFLVSVYSREPYYKDEGEAAIKGRGGMWDADRFARYNALDSAVLHDMLGEMKEDLRKMGNSDLYCRTMQLLEPVMYMQARGIHIDMEERARLSAHWRGEETRLLGELQREVQRYGVEQVNPNSPKQVAEFFYRTRKYKPYTLHGKETVDEEALTRLASRGEVAASLILDARSARKNYSTFIEATLGPDNRLRSSINPVGPVSGRFSSSKFLWGEGMDVQNYPKELRSMWTPDPGYVGYSVDLSGADNRCVAYFANERRQITAFESGQNLHKLTASLISRAVWGRYIPYEEIEKGSIEYKTGKKANHGLNYGMGKDKAALEWRCSQTEAAQVINAYFRAYPAIRATFHADVQATLGQTRTLTNPMGRNRYFFGRWGDSLFKDAYNWMAQSTVADVINFRGIGPLYWDERFAPVELLNQVHDEIMFQIPLGIGWGAHARIILELCQSLERPLVHKGACFIIPAAVTICRTFGPEGMSEMEDMPRDESTLTSTLRSEWNRLNEGRVA